MCGGLFTWFSLWGDLSLVILLMAVDSELYFLTDQIPHRRIYINYLEDPDLAPRVLGNQVREESWGREGMSRNFACVTCMNCPGAGAFVKCPNPYLVVLSSIPRPFLLNSQNQPQCGMGQPPWQEARRKEDAYGCSTASPHPPCRSLPSS